jgi:hypothetical protein
MPWITFGNDQHETAKAVVTPTPATPVAKREDPAWSKALTAAVVFGGLIVAAKSTSVPIKGGIEVTRVAY